MPKVFRETMKGKKSIGEMTDEEVQWCADHIDLHGGIHANKSTLLPEIGITDERAEELSTTYGGTLTRREKGKPTWELTQVFCTSPFLELIEPHLRIRCRQAGIGLELIRLDKYKEKAGKDWKKKARELVRSMGIANAEMKLEKARARKV